MIWGLAQMPSKAKVAPPCLQEGFHCPFLVLGLFVFEGRGGGGIYGHEFRNAVLDQVAELGNFLREFVAAEGFWCGCGYEVTRVGE